MRSAIKSLFITVMFAQHLVAAEIPDWYQEGVKKYVKEAEALVLYEIESIQLVRTKHIYKIYQINTKTLEVLKGKVPANHCYVVHYEGEWENYQQSIGKKRIAILRTVNKDGCSFIDNMMGAPGTEDYLELFKSMLNSKLGL